jgi:hypothetical protein
LENSIREIDFKLLESILLKEEIAQYNDAIQFINNSWSKNIGFTLVSRRPPKWNYIE